MTTIVNSGINYIAKLIEPENMISIGFNIDGIVRRYENGKLVKEFSSLPEYYVWIKANRPEETCE